ncbi:MAG: phosphoribosylanthranilate isomerase [Lachnospiraceae bacterium]|nr:phosphoribosylanthranilate isomerase [Lachnospiraceae bacterium]
MVKVKICGLMRPEDIDAVNEYRPDLAGFILARGRRRSLTDQQMRELVRALRPEIQSVAVFLDQDPAWIAELAAQDLMDVIQLHGQESNEEIRFLRENTDKKIIKAFRIEKADDIRTAQESEADLVLLDSGVGGTGEVFDWSLPEQMHRPYILAGGLNPENVRTALGQMHPYAVDVSSGVETGHCKDPEKIRQFIHAVRETAR